MLESALELATAALGRVFEPMADVVLDTLATPIFVVAVIVIFALQLWIPAKPDEKTLSLGFVQDIVWTFLGAVLRSFLLVGYVQLLKSVYAAHLSSLTLQSVGEWPDWLRLACGVVAIDFVRWFQHVVQHKVPWFWQFHALHHSQPQLNLFTDFRSHPVDYLVRRSFTTLPLLMLGLDAPRIVALTLLLRAHACLYHANIRGDFGPLRYVLVNPQSHRLHHSIEPQHRDHNYGSLLTVWDFLFGTQYRRYDEYPDTGIPDPSFPVEHSAKGLELLLTPLAQLVYPFREIARSLSIGLAKRSSS